MRTCLHVLEHWQKTEYRMHSNYNKQKEHSIRHGSTLMFWEPATSLQVCRAVRVSGGNLEEKQCKKYKKNAPS